MKDNIHSKEMKFTCVVKKINNEVLNCIQKLYHSTCTLPYKTWLSSILVEQIS